MKKLKNLLLGIGSVLAIFLTIAGVSAKKKSKKVKKIKKDLKENEKDIKRNRAKQDEVTRRKDDISKEIKRDLKRLMKPSKVELRLKRKRLSRLQNQLKTD